MTKQVIEVTKVFDYEHLGFSNCVINKGVAYLTGQAGIDEQGTLVSSTIERQSIKTFENIQTILLAAGASLADILTMTCFIVDIEKNGPSFFAIRQKMMPVSSYTSTSIGIAKLAIPGLLVEVQCIATLDSSPLLSAQD